MTTTFPDAPTLGLSKKDHDELIVAARAYLRKLNKHDDMPKDGAPALFYAACIWANAMGHDWPELTRWAIRISDDPKAVPDYE
jgi:hypothetical protein